MKSMKSDDGDDDALSQDMRGLIIGEVETGTSEVGVHDWARLGVLMGMTPLLADWARLAFLYTSSGMLA
ncbi:hypothetical protein L3X38_042898 [Prunus dulcis]|uniref:Uncharacterized protein n=1 Tax=Prunus dulcis TaxID=3755 RepID=A0AAD4UXF0_PRUDU|nr:hypothetical protein L3X38_042898 [Prunus dulcis]